MFFHTEPVMQKTNKINTQDKMYIKNIRVIKTFAWYSICLGDGDYLVNFELLCIAGQPLH